MRRILAWLIFLAVPAAPAGAAVESAVAARHVLDRAVAAMGGEAALRELASIRRDYVEDWVDVGQGQRPWSGDPPADRLPAHAGFDDSVAVSWLDYAGGRYYESIRYADSPNDYALVVESGRPGRAFQSITYMRERPFYAVRDAEAFEAERQRRLRRFPEGLLRAALDRPETLIGLGRVEEGGMAFDAIAFADAAGTLTRLYVDAATGRLARAETVRTHRIYGDTTGDTVYSDYRRVGALELPFAMVARTGGVPSSRMAIREIRIDAPAEPAWFEPPAGRVEIVPPPAEPRVEALGGGVYLIRGAYNLLFVEFSDHVLLVEAPMSDSYAKACLDLVEATVPGKPIRLVSTHFHFDHVAGVRTAIARGIPVLTTPDARAVIARSAGSRQALRPDALARAPREASIQVAGRRTVLEDGRQRVVLYDFGPMPHVGQILVVYVPALKLLHVADMLDVLTPEQVIAGVDGVVMAERIRELGLDVGQIVPMHGMPVTIDHLHRGLEIRRKYEETPR